MIDYLGFELCAEQICTPFFNARPNSEISLLVIHCISLPEGIYGGTAIKKLFTGQLNCSDHPTFNNLQGVEVSAHCVIYRDGSLEQYVSFLNRAWHAGKSMFNGVENCNDYAIGIELEGTDNSEFTDKQYQCLARLTLQLQLTYPAITTERIVAHSTIAPDRKSDPGKKFDWSHYTSLLK